MTTSVPIPQDKPPVFEMGPADFVEALNLFMEQAQGLFTKSSGIELFVIIVLAGLAYLMSRDLRKKMSSLMDDAEQAKKWTVPVINSLRRIIFPVMATMVLFASVMLAEFFVLPTTLLEPAMSLSVALIVINFFTSFVHSKVAAKFLSVIICIIVGLHILGWWDSVISLLDRMAISMGGSNGRLSVLMVMKGAVYIAIFLWLATGLSRLGQKQIHGLDELTPSLKVLFSKLLKITLITVAFLFSLSAIGFDLSSFALFSGAIGVGLGFGLQKVVSNFISGIILLVDRSIKPGDVIAVEGTFGWVNNLGARYVSLIQRDGKEHLIPNEIMITEKVENWSFTNNDIRLHIPLGVSYDSDVHLAMDLMLEALEEEKRIKTIPQPVVRCVAFGDSAVNLEARGWINDPVNGVTNVKSDVLLSVYDKFKANGISIPFPQRDLHLKSMPDEVLELLARSKPENG